MAMSGDSSKFNTAELHFSESYVARSDHQKTFNAHAIEYLAETLHSWFQPETELSILDLCCGDGGTTNNLLQALQQKGLKVKITGYDISPELIAAAKRAYSANPLLSFYEMNAEALSDKQQYHLVVSFFGLHWIEEIKKLVPRVHEALLPDGRVVFLVPLEKESLYHLRQQCMALPQWQEKFAGFTLHPFHDSATDYTDPFTEYFAPETGNVTDDHVKQYSKADFAKFLGSWLTEARFLKAKFGEDVAQQYISDLVDSIENSPYRYAYVSRDNEDSIQFIERLLFWQGKRRPQPQLTDEMQNIPPLTPLQSALSKGFMNFFKPKGFVSQEAELQPNPGPRQR